MSKVSRTKRKVMNGGLKSEKKQECWKEEGLIDRLQDAVHWMRIDSI